MKSCSYHEQVRIHCFYYPVKMRNTFIAFVCALVVAINASGK